MTYSPPTLRDLARYWVSKGGVNLGVVGDTRHQVLGRSYHLGRSNLRTDAYSRQTTRDRAGLTDAASAIDLGRLNGSLGHLRTFSVWLVKQCQANRPGTSDIREVIYTDDGKRVLRWDRERGVKSAPRTGEADNSHLTHTHVSFYRDSEKRPKVGVFAPYFAPNELAAGDDDGAAVQATKIIGFAGRILGAVLPEEDNTEGLFSGSATNDEVLIVGGTAAGNPNGVTFTVASAVAWWKEVFAAGLNVTKVRPTLLPGSKVLTEAGLAKARALATSSTDFAPEDYNPLGLEVVA
ncbi:MAG: hypothetical protein Q8Q29_00565 [Actinomycetota bacterium]|nr:hypothetical protein [Actinomycetota bacterium]